MSKQKRPAAHSKEGKTSQTRVDSAHANSPKANTMRSLLAAFTNKYLSSGSDASSHATNNRAEPKKFGLNTSQTADQDQADEKFEADQENHAEVEQDELVEPNSACVNGDESLNSKAIIRVDPAADTSRSHVVHAPQEPASDSTRWASSTPAQEMNDEIDSIDCPENEARESSDAESSDVEISDVEISDVESSDVESSDVEVRTEVEGETDDLAAVESDTLVDTATTETETVQEALVKQDVEIQNANMQLQLQASQLAGHLQDRKFDLQRRENEVNAQLASWDREHRDVELVFQQRAIELTEIKAELRQRCVELECQATEIATAAVSAERERQHWHCELESRERLLDDRERDLHSLQNQLHRQQSALVGFQLQSQAERERSLDADRLKQQQWSAQQLAEAEQLERLNANVEQNRDQLATEQSQQDARIKITWQEFQKKCEAETSARRQQLDREETRVALLESIFIERTEGLAREQTAFAAEQQAWETERQSQYKTLADRQRSGHEEIEKRRAELDKRQRFLEKRTEALEVLQSDVSKLHKACLEMRLVTEQVWADLADRADAGQMTQRIAQARRQWSEFVQDELQQVEDRKGEVASLLTKLQEEHKRLGTEKGELRKWIDRRYREIEEQAARLITRQRELNEEAVGIDQRKKEWQARGKELCGQILDLQTQLNQRRAA